MIGGVQFFHNPHSPKCHSSPLPQQPHCDGLYINRKAFDLSIDDSELDRCEVSGNRVFTIPQGKIEGILPQSLFYVYLEEDAEQPRVGELVVTEVKDWMANLSILPLGAQFSVPKSFCFVKQMSGFLAEGCIVLPSSAWQQPGAIS